MGSRPSVCRARCGVALACLLIAAWGPFKPNLINVAKAGELQAAATRLMDRAGYK